MEFIKLSTGTEMPLVGIGTNTFGKVGNDYSAEINDDTTELASAIAAGYRHFDTAISYRNERVIGKAVAESGLDREAFFITSKIPGRPEYIGSEQAVRDSVQASLDALSTPYIDLYLIHHPWDNLEEMMVVWHILEGYVDAGVLKAIGVSNFDEEQLQYILDRSRIKPAANQIESHLGKWNDSVAAFSLKQGVIPVAWGPLRKTTKEAEAKLTEIGNKYGKTWSQVALRYRLDRGVAVIPKSHNPERQKENLDVFDFELSEEDKNIIASL